MGEGKTNGRKKERERNTISRGEPIVALECGSDPRSCTGRRRCSSARLIKRRCGAQPLISGRRLAAGRSRGIHTVATLGSGRTVGGRAEEGGCRPVGLSGAKRDRRRRIGLGFGLRWGRREQHCIRSVVSASEPRPAPFASLKADTTGLIKTPTNK